MISTPTRGTELHLTYKLVPLLIKFDEIKPTNSDIIDFHYRNYAINYHLKYYT